ncbi:unnamed protein product [Phytomonas sp. Hart1]|nr:unnamed protein product [Phytomonas sp. Hart1]|eukprot:CCW68154.1 unnamed protein product [Phytomonas sp. isolate Hart1]
MSFEVNRNTSGASNTLTKVHVRVPATTANLGPAYDTLGMAISLFMDLFVEVADMFSFTMEGEGEKHISKGPENMLVKACELAFTEYGKRPMPPLKFHVVNRIPYCCGCGSSSAAAVAGFVSGLHLCGLSMATYNQEELLSVITRIEGHPDNAAPAIYGGLRLSFTDLNKEVGSHSVSVPANLALVLFVPNKLMKADTHTARGLIPTHVSLEDAVHNVSRASLLILALTSGRLHILKDCSDRLHEQHRADKLYPHYYPCLEASRATGAEYTFLSGAGPTVCAMVSGRRGDILLQPPEERLAEKVAEAMLKAAATTGVQGRAIITRVSDIGAHCVGFREFKENILFINN